MGVEFKKKGVPVGIVTDENGEERLSSPPHYLRGKGIEEAVSLIMFRQERTFRGFVYNSDLWSSVKAFEDMIAAHKAEAERGDLYDGEDLEGYGEAYSKAAKELHAKMLDLLGDRARVELGYFAYGRFRKYFLRKRLLWR